MELGSSPSLGSPHRLLPSGDKRTLLHMSDALTAEDILDCVVEAWHIGHSELPLHEYMGLSWEQYARWTEEGVAGLRQPPETVLAPTKLDELRAALEQIRALTCDVPSHDDLGGYGEAAHAIATEALQSTEKVPTSASPGGGE